MFSLIRERFQQLQNLARKYAFLRPEVILSKDELNLDQAPQNINKEFQLERARLQAFVAATDPGWMLRFVCIVDPESYAGSSLANGRVTQARQIGGETSDEEAHSGPTGEDNSPCNETQRTRNWASRRRLKKRVRT
ncbi:uncharacterized protein TNCV_2876171 [Trichonephila clavipes]|nr:uncharacterized protein TNCV_2876171 [Trichonephila clavipes]